MPPIEAREKGQYFPCKTSTLKLCLVNGEPKPLLDIERDWRLLGITPESFGAKHIEVLLFVHLQNTFLTPNY